MDNIAIEAYALSCLLPLAVFLLLLYHLLLPSHPAPCLPASSALASPEHPSSSQCGTSHLVASQLHCCDSLNDQPALSQEAVDWELPHSLDWKLAIPRRPRGSFLEGCLAGLARMRLLNGVYFERRAESDCGKQVGRRRRQGWRGFEPTHLVTIVEGLQY